MPRPIVIAHHLIWTAYGWWLPNDPRGSGSTCVRNDVPADLCELHLGRKKIQPAGKEIREFYKIAADRLKHPLLTFDESSSAIIAQAFTDVVAQQHYTCYACAIMPDHVHLLIRKHRHIAEEMIEHLQHESRARLIVAGRRSPTHPTWPGFGHGWRVFLDHPDDVHRTIRFVEQNPIKLGLPAQRWPFITDYDSWPLHPGHSPDSPYARRLREAGRLAQ